MRVLYVWDADYPWDVRTEKLCRTMTAAGHEVTIAARNKAWAPLAEDRPEGTVRRMRPWRWLGRRLDGLAGFPAFMNPRWIRHLARSVTSTRAEVIVVRDLPLCPTAIWIGRRYNIPVVLDMAENYAAMIQETWDAGRHALTDWVVRNPKFVRRVERYCLSRVDHVLTVVRESSDRIIALGMPPERVTVVSNTPPLARAERFARLPRPAANGHLDVVYLGLMEIPRGVGDLLTAVARLSAEGRQIRLRLIGDGRDRAWFERLARELGLRNDTVQFAGYVANDEALDLVARADVGVVPHHADEAWNTTIPNKLFDYLAAGLPVVSSDALPCARIVTETGAGRVFRSQDPDALADALDGLFDPALRAALSEAGRRAIHEEYHWETDARRLLGVLEQVAVTPG